MDYWLLLSLTLQRSHFQIVDYATEWQHSVPEPVEAESLLKLDHSLYPQITAVGLVLTHLE